MNKTDRYNLAIDALQKGSKSNPKLIRMLEKKLSDHAKYIVKYGKDMEEIENWKWE